MSDAKKCGGAIISLPAFKPRSTPCCRDDKTRPTTEASARTEGAGIQQGWTGVSTI
jgi:hypothetical protein